PDHFLRTRISPLYVPWDPGVDNAAALRTRIDERLAAYRDAYVAYYRSHARPDSPALRDSNPSVVVIPTLGVFGFAKDKREARITTEFFVNAIHVMQGATAREDDSSQAQSQGQLADAGSSQAQALPQELPARRGGNSEGGFTSFHNYVALPRAEAFRIEYWALEEAQLQPVPAGKEFSRRIAPGVGGARRLRAEAV